MSPVGIMDLDGVWGIDNRSVLIRPDNFPSSDLWPNIIRKDLKPRKIKCNGKPHAKFTPDSWSFKR